MRGAALVYGAFLLAIVALADVGVLAPLVQGIHRVPLGDKLAHLVLATGLGFFAAVLAPRPALGRVPTSTTFVLAVASLEELSQRWVAGRTFDLVDLAADVIGIATGTVLALRGSAVGRTASQVGAPHT